MENNNIVNKITELVLNEINSIMNIKKTSVPLSISARHIHLSEEDMEILFGKGYKLTSVKDLSQPGQFAALEKVDLIGPKSEIKNVRILGPVRSKTQIEVSQSDARKLGVQTEVRHSGQIDNTLGIYIRGPKGMIKTADGLILANRHIHMTEKDARDFGLVQNEVVSLKIDGEKGGILNNVHVRISDDYKLDCHLDTDDGNAFQIKAGSKGEIIKLK